MTTNPRMTSEGLVAILFTVDPGRATGYSISGLYSAAHAQVPEERQPTYTHPAFSKVLLQPLHTATFQIEEAGDTLRLMIHAAHQQAAKYGVPLRVIIERFVVTRLTMQTNETWSTQVTTLVEDITRTIDPEAADHIDKTQKPSEMKNLVHKNQMLEHLGLRRRGDRMTQHEADALGHAILYAARLSNRLTRL